MQIQDTNIAPLRVAARPGSSLDEFNVYYQAFKNNKGLVKVKLSVADMKLPSEYHKAFAEVKALEYLLAGIEIMSEGRKGDTVHLTVTTRHYKDIILINKLSRQMRGQLLNESKSLKYIKGTKLPLVCYTAMTSFMPSVIARFLSAGISVSDDVKWIDPVVPEKNIHYHVSNQIVYHRADINGQSVSIMPHAFSRFKQRVSFNTPDELWNAFLAYFRQASVKLPLNEKERNEYVVDGVTYVTRYYNPEFFWHFIVIKSRDQLYLVTCYKMEVNS